MAYAARKRNVVLTVFPARGANLIAQQASRWLLEDAPGNEVKLSDG